MLAVLPFEDEERVIELANGVQYGLAATIWTRDIARAHRVARRLQAPATSASTTRPSTSSARPSAATSRAAWAARWGRTPWSRYTQIKNVVVNLSDVGLDWFKL